MSVALCIFILTVCIFNTMVHGWADNSLLMCYYEIFDGNPRAHSALCARNTPSNGQIYSCIRGGVSVIKDQCAVKVWTDCNWNSCIKGTWYAKGNSIDQYLGNFQADVCKYQGTTSSINTNSEGKMEFSPCWLGSRRCEYWCYTKPPQDPSSCGSGCYWSDYYQSCIVE
eukprot:UN12256